MKLASSHSKIEEIFEIVDGLDDLDKEAWMKLISTAELKRENEIKADVTSDIKEANEVLNSILPLVKLARLMIASEEITPNQRTMIVRSLIQELVWLLSPIEVAGLLQSLIYSNFEKGRLQAIPMMIMPAQAIQEEKKDESGTVV